MALVSHPEKVFREVPFTTALPVREANDFVVVQGVIDVLFVEEDGMTILDYKTDVFPREAINDMAEKYGPQVSLYALAASKLLSLPVKRVSIVFLSDGREVDIDWTEQLLRLSLVHAGSKNLYLLS